MATDDRNPLQQSLLSTIRNRIVTVYPAQIRACLHTLSEEQIWWRPNEQSNSVGNIVLHLSGSLKHYLNRGIGGIPYDRDREQEFAERRTLPLAELMAIFDSMVSNAEKTLESLDETRLLEPSVEPARYDFLAEDLLNIALHVSTHTGQIVWITKMLVEGGLNDIWISTHKTLGAWKDKL